MPEGVGSDILEKRLLTLDSWLFQKSGSFIDFVKNEATVDAWGMYILTIRV